VTPGCNFIVPDTRDMANFITLHDDRHESL
jgi:hypothetical protein